MITNSSIGQIEYENFEMIGPRFIDNSNFVPRIFTIFVGMLAAISLESLLI